MHISLFTNRNGLKFCCCNILYQNADVIKDVVALFICVFFIIASSAKWWALHVTSRSVLRPSLILLLRWLAWWQSPSRLLVQIVVAIDIYNRTLLMSALCFAGLKSAGSSTVGSRLACNSLSQSPTSSTPIRNFASTNAYLLITSSVLCGSAWWLFVLITVLVNSWERHGQGRNEWE